MAATWVRQAQKAVDEMGEVRALDLIESNAFGHDVSSADRADALDIVRAIRRVARFRVYGQELETRASLIAARLDPPSSRLGHVQRSGAYARPRRKPQTRTAEEERALEEAAVRRKRNEERRREAKLQREKRRERAAVLVNAGLPPHRAEAMAGLEPGPYDVILRGAGRNCDADAIVNLLLHLGYDEPESRRTLERTMHIAPETIAILLEESEAIRIKIELESAGGKVKIALHA